MTDLGINHVFDLMDYEDIDDEYMIGAYNGISITMDVLFKSFRINDLFKTLTKKPSNKRPSMDVSRWMERKVGSNLYNDPLYHNDFYLKANCSTKVCGWYAPMILFDVILYSIKPLKAQKWVIGLTWQKPEEGYLYMVQTKAHQKAEKPNVYKVGRTWNAEQRYQAYGDDDCVEFKLVKVLDMHDAEKILIRHFEQVFERGERDGNAKGEEYFIINDLNEGIAVFDKALIEIRKKGL